jgi:hypothetical protein
LGTRQGGSISTPDRPKRIHECFRAADTPNEEATFAFALPIIGRNSWPAAG